MKKSNQKNNEKHNREEFADKLRLPKDILLGSSIITAIGKTELWIENYKGILEYTDEVIHIQGKNGKITIEGIGLCIDYYSNEDMKIIGRICMVRFL